VIVEWKLYVKGTKALLPNRNRTILIYWNRPDLTKLSSG